MEEHASDVSTCVQSFVESVLGSDEDDGAGVGPVLWGSEMRERARLLCERRVLPIISMGQGHLSHCLMTPVSFRTDRLTVEN